MGLFRLMSHYFSRLGESLGKTSTKYSAHASRPRELYVQQQIHYFLELTNDEDPLHDHVHHDGGLPLLLDLDRHDVFALRAVFRCRRRSAAASVPGVVAADDAAGADEVDGGEDVGVAEDGVVEGGVVGDDDGHVDGGEEDEDVPARLEDAVVGEHPAGLLGDGGLVLGERLNVGGWRAQEGLWRKKDNKGYQGWFYL